ncbi:urease accessory protein UreF [Litoreibacter ponti]|nr:urease accessory UreF family protein [Litoreibacter ponti]
MTDYLTLTQWLSPAFPVGSFAYSHGLERAIDAGDVSDAAGLQAWLTGVLRFGAGRSDAVLLKRAMAGADVADLTIALCASKEREDETMAQGRAFLAATNGIYGENLPDMAFPVAVGTVAQRLSLSPEEVAKLYLHAFASNLVSVAVRFVPLGQTEGQAVLSALHEVIAEVAAETEIWTGALGADIAAMEHEVMETRVFRT